MRLQKVLAAAGLASRRASEQIILAGRVAVNGQTVRQLGVQADPDQERITVDGRPVHSRRKLYLALNKPKGYLCTRRDPEHRHTVGELLPHEWADVYPVGRLDYDTEGLLFLTNDGGFCLRLTHPRYGITKRYLVTVDGRIEPEALRSLTRGVVHTGERLIAEQARLLRASSSLSVFELVLKEGRNREVRRMCESQDWRVRQLRRTQIGPIKLGELRPGKWRLLTPPELDRLLAAAPESGTAPRPPGAPREPVVFRRPNPRPRSPQQH
jgi:23S rRNA pseudouridine2605 synthase